MRPIQSTGRYLRDLDAAGVGTASGSGAGRTGRRKDGGSARNRFYGWWMRQVPDVELTDTCEAVADTIDQATSALLGADPVAAHRVLTAPTPASRLADWQEETIAVLVGRRRLAHGELREAIAAARAVTELERMHDLARHIAKIVRMHGERPVLPVPLRQRFADMGDIARQMTLAAGCVLYYGDRGYVATVSAAEKEMDELHRSLFPVLTAVCRDDMNGIDAGLVSQFYEQYADHAVLLAAQFAATCPGSPSLQNKRPRSSGDGSSSSSRNRLRASPPA